MIIANRILDTNAGRRLWLAQIGANLSNDDTATPENYPAFYFAKDYKNVTGSHVSGTEYENGWYLPAIAELYDINKEWATVVAANAELFGIKILPKKKDKKEFT